MSALPTTRVYSDVDEGTLYFFSPIDSFTDSRLPSPLRLVAAFQPLVSPTHDLSR